MRLDRSLFRPSHVMRPEQAFDRHWKFHPRGKDSPGAAFSALRHSTFGGAPEIRH
jgi:hypothetical protein